MDRSGQAQQTVKPRKELNWWHSFNSWWRDEYDKLGRRPRMQEVDEWYNENAERIWGAEKPSLEATRDHAKCLRSKKELREYFQRYNAKKFGRPFTDLRHVRGGKQRSSSLLSPGSNSEQGAVAGGSTGGSLVLSAGGSGGATPIHMSSPQSGRAMSPGGSSLGGYSDGVVLVGSMAALSESDALAEGPGAAAAYHDVGQALGPAGRVGHGAGPSTGSPQRHTTRNRSSGGGIVSGDTLSNATNANSSGGGGGGSQHHGAAVTASASLPGVGSGLGAGLKGGHGQGPGPGPGPGAGAGRQRAPAGRRPPLAVSLASQSQSQSQSHAGLHSFSGGGTTTLAPGSGAEDEDAAGVQDGPVGPLVASALKDPYAGNKTRVTRYLAGLASNVLGGLGGLGSGGVPATPVGPGGSAVIVDHSGSCEDTATMAQEGLMSQLTADPYAAAAAAAPRLVAVDAEGVPRQPERPQLAGVASAAVARIVQAAACGWLFPSSQGHASGNTGGGSVDDGLAEAGADGDGPRGTPGDFTVGYGDGDNAPPLRRQRASVDTGGGGVEASVDAEEDQVRRVAGCADDPPEMASADAPASSPRGGKAHHHKWQQCPDPRHDDDGHGLQAAHEPSLASLALLSEARGTAAHGDGDGGGGSAGGAGSKRGGVSVALPKVPSLRPHGSGSDAVETPSLCRPPKLLRLEVFAAGRAGAAPGPDAPSSGPRAPAAKEPSGAAEPRAFTGAAAAGTGHPVVDVPVPVVSTCSSGQALGPPPDPFRLPVLAKRRSLEQGPGPWPGPPGCAVAGAPPVLQPALTARESVITRGLQPPLFGRELAMRESVGTANVPPLGPRDSLETRLMPPPPPSLLEQSSIVRSSNAGTTVTIGTGAGTGPPHAAPATQGPRPAFSTGLDVMAAAAALMAADGEGGEELAPEYGGATLGAGEGGVTGEGAADVGGGGEGGISDPVAKLKGKFGPVDNVEPVSAVRVFADGNRGDFAPAGDAVERGPATSGEVAALLPPSAAAAAATASPPPAAVGPRLLAAAAAPSAGAAAALSELDPPERPHVIFQPKQVELGLVKRALNGRIVEAPVQVITVQLTVPARAVEALRAASSGSLSLPLSGGAGRTQGDLHGGPGSTDA